MGQRPFQPPTLGLCIQSVIDVAYAYRLSHRNSAIGNLVRVHLGQTVLLTVAPKAMPDLLTVTPMEALTNLPGSGGHHEQAERCVRVARQALALYSLSPESQREDVTDLVYVGTRAYRLAADTAASHDRWFGDLWWELGTRFPRYGHVVADSSRLIDHLH